MVIAETASRNVVYKATELGESIFERQSEMLIPEEDLAVRSSVTNEEDLKDLGYNADLYVFDDQTVEGYRNTNTNVNILILVNTNIFYILILVVVVVVVVVVKRGARSCYVKCIWGMPRLHSSGTRIHLFSVT